MLRKPVHPKIEKELSQALKRLREAAVKDERLGMLFLIDPIRAFADADVELSPAAQKYLYRTYPGFFYADNILYKDVRDGKKQLPWIKRVKFRSSKMSTCEEAL